MNNNFAEEVKVKLTDELREIAVNFNLYRGALVSAARQELINRGIELTDEEKLKIEQKKEQRRNDAIKSKESNKTWGFFDVNWKQSIVTDIDAPQLYSRQVINIFSILFSVMFGGILLAINLKSVNNKKAILPVLIYSIMYTGIMIYILNLIPGSKSGLSLIFNLFGAIVLYNFFWGKYIGKDFKYRTKQIWIPLIIGVLMSGLFIWALIVGSEI
jgi:hypothetical protein